MVIIGAVAIGLMLTGCNQLSLEEIQASDRRIVETGFDFWEGEYWSYVGPNGDELALTEKCGGFLEGKCWTDPDGLVEFRYSKGKSGISSERMIFDGVEWSMECLTTDFWSIEYVCAPV